MGWTTPKTWATNEVVTAANMNTHVRDNVSFLGSPPACSVKAAGAQSISNATTTTLNADTETYDTDSMHSNVTNNSRITINTAGRYLVMASVRFAADVDGIRLISFFRNASTEDAAMLTLATASSDTSLSAARSYSFSAADFIEVRAHQTSGAALNVTLEDFTAVLITVP